jgi:hypothetical protein
MSRKQKAVSYFIPAMLGNWGKFMKNLMAFSESRYADSVVAKNGFSDGLSTIDLLDLVPDFNETVSSFTFLDGTSRVTDIALLKSLAKKFNNECEYLEIGSWRGESLLNVAPLCKNAVSLSLSKEEMKEFGFDERFIKMDGYFIKQLPNLKVIGHNSLTFDFSSLGKKFDLIFVDGDHSFEGVMSDTQNAFKLLKNENSIIVWHDFGESYEHMRNEVIGGVLEGAPAEAKKHIYRVSNTLCGIYIKGSFNTSRPGSMTEPNKTFDVSIKAQRIKK